MLATFMGATLMVAAIAFILGMGELWGVGVESRLYNKHVRGVSRFLEQTFEKAASRAPISAITADGEEAAPAENEETMPVYWGTWGNKENSRKEYLTFEMDESPGLLVWPGDPMPQVVCSLDFEEGEGLYLLWMSRLEKEFEEEEPRRTMITPYLTQIKYHYLDAEDDDEPEWEVFDEPETETNGDPILPQRIELVFEYDEEILTRHLMLPARISGVPLF
tara:strand:- start:58 stop:717 length:660 start_codon:yes stop_codon:yes gene_type:complete